jgi:hypothetical protein
MKILSFCNDSNNSSSDDVGGSVGGWLGGWEAGCGGATPPGPPSAIRIRMTRARNLASLSLSLFC